MAGVLLLLASSSHSPRVVITSHDARADDEGSANGINKIGSNHGSWNDGYTTSRPRAIQLSELCRTCLTRGSREVQAYTGSLSSALSLEMRLTRRPIEIKNQNVGLCSSSQQHNTTQYNTVQYSTVQCA